jgi:hypothetical protein
VTSVFEWLAAEANTIRAGRADVAQTPATTSSLSLSPHPSKMKVTSKVTRNSSISPFLTLAFLLDHIKAGYTA